MRIWVILCHIILWIVHGISGLEYCGPNAPEIHVCTSSTGNNEDNVMHGVYVNTGIAPILTENVCMCTILPTTTKPISLYIKGDASMPTDKFTVEINNVILNDLPGLSTVDIDGKPELVYSTSFDFHGGLCLSIAPTSLDGIFSMTCVVRSRNEEMATAEDTTLSTGHNTDTASERTVSPTQTKPPNDANTDRKINMTLAFGIAGSFVGATVIVAVIIVIVCRKRKRESDCSQATAPHQIGNVNDGTNGGQPNAAYENCGEVLQMHTSENKDHYEELDKTYIDLSSNNDYSKLQF